MNSSLRLKRLGSFFVGADMTQLYDPKTAASVTALAQKILKNQLYGNLCQEIVLPMSANFNYSTLSSIKWKTEPKYKFSRSKWYEAKLHKNVSDALDWCEQQFGKEPNHPDAWSRWYFNVNRAFRFRDEKDYAWFMLRWS